MIPADTDPEAFEVQLEIWRRMDPKLKFEQVIQHCNDIRQLTLAGIRGRHPTYNAEQLKHAAFRLFLGDALYREVWPEREFIPA